MKILFERERGTIEKVRRKLRDHTGEYVFKMVWECPCKVGTTNLTKGYFFDRPEVGKHNYVSKDMGKETAQYKAIPVIVDQITELEWVFCTPM